MIIWKEIREMQNVDAEKIQQELGTMIDYPVYSYLTIFNNYIILLLMNSIIGLILAFILKKIKSTLKISVVIPLLNESESLVELVDSLMK